MAKSMSELRTIIKKAIEMQVMHTKYFENDKNPQIVAMYNNSKGQIDAFEAVLCYLDNGSKAMFDFGSLVNDVIIQGISGKWNEIARCIIDGKEYFLMEDGIHGNDVPYLIIDIERRLIAENVTDKGFKDVNFLKVIGK